MKRMIIALLLLSAGRTLSYAQCDKKVIITSSKTEHLGADSTVQQTEDEKTTVEFDKMNITIIPGSEDHKMTGTIKSYTCDWKVAFREGRTALKVTLADEHGETKDVRITIGGKDGKISFLAEMEDMPDRKIRLVVDKFEEKQ
jgi:hypothetical protein